MKKPVEFFICRLPPLPGKPREIQELALLPAEHSGSHPPWGLCSVWTRGQEPAACQEGSVPHHSWCSPAPACISHTLVYSRHTLLQFMLILNSWAQVIEAHATLKKLQLIFSLMYQKKGSFTDITNYDCLQQTSVYSFCTGLNLLTGAWW